MNTKLRVPSHSGRSLPLDGLRGAGCIGVLFLHGHYAGFFYWFWTLVDMFFVLSGFLIARLILRGLNDRSFSLRNFMIHRALRVWPVYYLTLMVCLLPVLYEFVATRNWEPINGVLSSPFFLQFTFFYFEPGMTGPYLNFIPSFHHSWSLAVEEQFYVLLPLLVLLLRNRMALFVGFLLACVMAAVYFRYAGVKSILLLTRMDGLAIGVLLAVYWVYIEEWSRLPRWKIQPVHAAVLLCLAWILMGFYLVIPLLSHRLPEGIAQWRVALGLLGFNLFYAFLVLIIAKEWMPWFSRFLSWRLFVWFGGISYALYMFHLPVRGMILELEGVRYISQVSIAGQLAYFVVPVLLAILSKSWLEQPILRLKRFFPLYPQQNPIPRAVGAAVI